MSPETDQPRQRTVAELLAENGGPGSTGRRRRRRETDGPDDAVQSGDRPAAGGPPPGPPPDPYAPPPSAGRWPAPPADSARVAGYRGAQGLDSPVRGPELPPGAAPNGAGSNGAARNGAVPNGTAANGAGYGGPPAGGGPHQRPSWSPDPAPPPDPPTEQMPRIRDDRPPLGRPPVDDATGPIDRYTAEATTAVRPHAAEDTTALRTNGAPAAPWEAAGRDDADGGPPTMLGSPPLADDEEDRADAPARQRSPEPPAFRRAETSFDGGPPTQAARLDDLDDHDDGHDDPPAGLADDEYDEYDDHDDGSAEKPQRRLGRGAATREESPGSAWAAVLAQWIAGAVTGAALWVGFRYLWFNLPVVALAAAVLVTVALVLGVRAMLRNDDLRTTIFAVLVGLLLTVSPALLVLLGR